MRRSVHIRRPKTARSSLYQCEQCGVTERVPANVLAYFDETDPDDTGAPATFRCEACPGIMYPDWWFRAERATP